MKNQNSPYAIFGTGQAAEQALAYANANDLVVTHYVDDLAAGMHHGLAILSWESFLLRQLEFTALLMGRHQRGEVASRENLIIPLLLIDQKLVNPPTYNTIDNIQKLTSLKQKHAGKRCFIIGNGPSLTASDLSLLKNEITFASNKIYLVYPETDWRPTYYFVEDYLVAKNNAQVINSLPGVKFFEFSTLAFLRVSSATCVYQFTHIPTNTVFSRDIVNGVTHAHTVVGSQLQFAYYMGFAEAILLGVDFDFIIPNGNCGKLFGTIDILRSQGEKNHFHPDYRPLGEVWSYPNLEKQQQFFNAVLPSLPEQSFTIRNASRFSKLTSFPRCDLESLLHGSAHE
ncbi:6-hydroxymethylpterin diphosphokinase MptE-like protein [Chrysiogenes arsenatis]|uniref:6-hydroxymethylpterin diphosphokinase MptE-like protein n=1 Tax=Chrysiogenes arsenatis TaxID=309797 RepID=UPI000423AF36|nr:6-hydroxymethylpterin diphosphokinase MptE-like protein [Chrysiogenes arsenatis]